MLLLTKLHQTLKLELIQLYVFTVSNKVKYFETSYNLFSPKFLEHFYTTEHLITLLFIVPVYDINVKILVLVKLQKSSQVK